MKLLPLIILIIISFTLSWWIEPHINSKRKKYNICKTFFSQYENSNRYLNIAYNIIYNKPYTSHYAKNYYQKYDDLISFCHLIIVEYSYNKSIVYDELIESYFYLRKNAYCPETENALQYILVYTHKQYESYFDRKKYCYSEYINELHEMHQEKYRIKDFN